jgi:GWxTD domain-containing protein
MRRFSHRTILFLAILVGVCGVAHAQLSETYAGWADGPEGYLLTKKELKEWQAIHTDAEAKAFIDLFWARRNPRPGTAFNEFKARFESMVTYCDENFGYEGHRGAMSDMGKVFLLMGPPHNVLRRGPTQTVSGTGLATGAGQSDRGSDEVRAEVKLWSYDPARMDTAFKLKGTSVEFTFYEQRPGTNEFVLDRSYREATIGLKALRSAPEVYLLHPDLDTVPKPVSVPNATPATAEDLAALATENGPLQGQLHVMRDLGVADAAHRPFWLHLGVPADAAAVDTLAGRILSADGQEVLSTFEIAADPMTAGTERAYHLTFPLAAGAYRYEVAGLSGSAALFVDRESIEIPEVGEGTWASQLWVGLNVQQNPQALLGEAYTFGGWHLMPLAVPTAPKSSELSYFGYVINPEVAEGVEPKVKLKLSLRKDGKRLGNPLSMDLPLVAVTGEVFMYANALNLAALPAGACELEFKVSVPDSEVTVERTVALDIVE